MLSLLVDVVDLIVDYFHVVIVNYDGMVDVDCVDDPIAPIHAADDDLDNEIMLLMMLDMS